MEKKIKKEIKKPKTKEISRFQTLKDLRKEHQKVLMDIYSGKEKNVKKASVIRKQIARIFNIQSLHGSSPRRGCSCLAGPF